MANKLERLKRKYKKKTKDNGKKQDVNNLLNESLTEDKEFW